MTQEKRYSDESPDAEHVRTERFIEKDDGFYLKTREGVDGPYKDLAAALNGLMKLAEESGIGRYQMRKLYESVCEKALSICD